MSQEDNPTANPLMQAFAPLHRSALGTAGGIVLGTIIFLATLVSMERDWQSAEHLGLLSQFFVGYSVSLRGAFIGLIWGFVTGYALGWTFALLRNVAVWIYLVALRSRADMEQYGDFLDHM
jgi:hypothetical protein